MYRQHRDVEYKQAKRAIAFLLPLLCTIGAGLLAMLGLEVIDPFTLFMAVIFSSCIAFWGGWPLLKTKKAHAVELKEAIERLKSETNQ